MSLIAAADTRSSLGLLLVVVVGVVVVVVSPLVAAAAAATSSSSVHSPMRLFLVAKKWA
jgi:hypothetical protein